MATKSNYMGVVLRIRSVWGNFVLSLRSFYTKALFIKSFLSTIIIVISLEWEVNMLWHSEELENESKKRSSDARESSAKRNEMRNFVGRWRRESRREKTKEFSRISPFFLSFLFSTLPSLPGAEFKMKWKKGGSLLAFATRWCEKEAFYRAMLVAPHQISPPNFSTPLQVS